MNTDRVRRCLHSGNAVLALALLASGLLVAEPDLRGALVGGYGREILDFHLWCGAAMIALPLMALTAAARSLLLDLHRRTVGMPASRWRALHIEASLALSFVAVLSGIALWEPIELPTRALDLSLTMHTWSSWTLAAVVVLHILAVRRKIAARVSHLGGGAARTLRRLSG